MNYPVVLEKKVGLNNYWEVLTLKRNIKGMSEFKYSGIWVFSGAQGNGKTLFLISNLLDIHNEYPNAKIYSNINLYGVQYEPYTGVECFEDANGQDGIIYVIDEIHTLFSSLESKNMSGSLLTVWSQNRKNRRLILSTSQRWSRVAKPIREQASFNIECRKGLFPSTFHYRIIDTSVYDDNGELPKEPDALKKFVSPWKMYIPNARTMLSYDTLEVVNRAKFNNKVVEKFE